MKTHREGMEEACPLSDLSADAFHCIVEEVSERLRLGREAMRATDARTLCQDFLEARRELRTLALVPNQVVDPTYLDPDPNGALWLNAHAFFGVDPTDTVGMRKLPRITLRDNFLHLRRAFDPDLEFETYDGVAELNRLAKPWITVSVWDCLWNGVAENGQLREAWEAEMHRQEYHAYCAETRVGVDHRYTFDEWVDLQEEAGLVGYYPISKPDILALQARLRNPHDPRRERLVEQLRWSSRCLLRELRHPDRDSRCIDGLRRVFLPPRAVRREGSRPAVYDYVGPTIASQEEECVRKVKALRILFKSIKRQILREKA
jgi:hypothetical protein